MNGHGRRAPCSLSYPTKQRKRLPILIGSPSAGQTISHWEGLAIEGV